MQQRMTKYSIIRISYFSICSQPHTKLNVTSVPTLELPMPVAPQLLIAKIRLCDFCDQFVRYLPRY